MKITFNVCDRCGEYSRKLVLRPVSVTIKIDGDSFAVHRDWCNECVEATGIASLIADTSSQDEGAISRTPYRQVFLGATESILIVRANPLINESKKI